MDFALFLLIFLAFYTSGQLLTKRLLGLKFSGSVEAFLFSTAVGSIFFSALATVLVFVGWINSAVCWSILGAFLLIGWKNLLHLKFVLNIFQETTAQWHAALKNLAQSFLALLAFLSYLVTPRPVLTAQQLILHCTDVASKVFAPCHDTPIMLDCGKRSTAAGDCFNLL